jgi:ferredoxin
VEQWILKTTFSGSRDAYFVLTCGDGCGNASSYVRTLCKEKRFQFRGLASVVMPENYLALFPTPDEAESKNILARAKPQIDALAAQIKKGDPFSEPKVSLLGKLESGPANPLFYRFAVKDKGFTASSACTACGLCAKRCPLNNITLEEKVPTWHGNCTHCMACIAGCPTDAIEYKNKSKGKHRYYIMEDECP